jgi:hypothetical protein
MQKNNEWEEFHSEMACCSSNREFLNVNKLNPDAGNHKTSSDSPTCEDHSGDERQEEGGNVVNSRPTSLKSSVSAGQCHKMPMTEHQTY